MCVFHAVGYTVICRGWSRWPMLWRVFTILQLSREARRCFTQRLYVLASFLVLSTIFAWITVPALLRFAIDWRGPGGGGLFPQHGGSCPRAGAPLRPAGDLAGYPPAPP